MDELLTVFQEEVLQTGDNQILTSGLLIETDSLMLMEQSYLASTIHNSNHLLRGNMSFHNLHGEEKRRKRFDFDGKLF